MRPSTLQTPSMLPRPTMDAGSIKLFPIRILSRIAAAQIFHEGGPDSVILAACRSSQVRSAHGRMHMLIFALMAHSGSVVVYAATRRGLPHDEATLRHHVCARVKGGVVWGNQSAFMHRYASINQRQHQQPCWPPPPDGARVMGGGPHKQRRSG